MNPAVLVCLLGLFASTLTQAQRRLLSFPFEFEKSFLARADYDAYFLGFPGDESFAIVMKDNKKAAYALVDKNFKLVTEIRCDIGKTVFTHDDAEYAGGTTARNKYYFVYNKKSDCYLETVDFGSKTLSQQKLFEIPKGEKPLVSFSDFNRYYAFTANDKSGDLVVYSVNNQGVLAQKTIPFQVPEDASKGRRKLSTYLSELKVFKGLEDPDLSNAIKSAKVFSSPDKLQIVVNDGDNSTQVVTLSLPGLSATEKFFKYDGIIAAEERGKVYINSFIKNNKLFSLALNKRNIRIIAHDLQTSSVLSKIEINEDSQPDYALMPVTEKRLGKRASEKEIEGTRKLIKALTKGTEGIMITETKSGQLILTVGTYDFLPVEGGGGFSSGSYQGGYTTRATVAPGSSNIIHIPEWNPHMYYLPGRPGYSKINARYYSSTYFRLQVDPSSLKVTRGSSFYIPVADQVKDFIETIDRRAAATNQFAIGKKQYYGYYDRSLKSYVVDFINIREH